jgi:hypothetical protein
MSSTSPSLASQILQKGLKTFLRAKQWQICNCLNRDFNMISLISLIIILAIFLISQKSWFKTTVEIIVQTLSLAKWIGTFHNDFRGERVWCSGLQAVGCASLNLRLLKCCHCVAMSLFLVFATKRYLFFFLHIKLFFSLFSKKFSI